MMETAPQQRVELAPDSEQRIKTHYRYKCKWFNIGMILCSISWLISMILISLYLRKKYSSECIDPVYKTNAFDAIRFMMINMALTPIFIISVVLSVLKPNTSVCKVDPVFFNPGILSFGTMAICFALSLVWSDPSCVFRLDYIPTLFSFANVAFISCILVGIGCFIYLTIVPLVVYVVKNLPRLVSRSCKVFMNLCVEKELESFELA